MTKPEMFGSLNGGCRTALNEAMLVGPRDAIKGGKSAIITGAGARACSYRASPGKFKRLGQLYATTLLALTDCKDNTGNYGTAPARVMTCLTRGCRRRRSLLAWEPVIPIPAPAGRRLSPPPSRLVPSPFPPHRERWPALPRARSSAGCMPTCPGSTSGRRGKRCLHRASSGRPASGCRTSSTIGPVTALFQARPGGVDQS